MMTSNVEIWLTSLLSKLQEHRSEWASFLSKLPTSMPCPAHPQVRRQRDDQKSWSAGRAVFQPCELCRSANVERRIQAQLEKMGVPPTLCSATFDNWNAVDVGAEQHLKTIRKFANNKIGFLILLGDPGTGKGHLSAAVLRSFKSGWFIKQSELLRQLRHTYRDRAAVDPVDKAQSAGCLVLDEIGISPGGRDELPMLHDILDFRYGHQKPTILTSNLNYPSLVEVIGKRMEDRLRESAYGILIFGGESYRRKARSTYFKQNPDSLERH